MGQQQAGVSLNNESLFQRAVDWIFGFDFFISYSHKDGRSYPWHLKQYLERAGYKIFLDQTDYVPGMELARETRRHVKKCRTIVVIGRPGAMLSDWVKQEIDIALEDGKTPLIIDINNSVSGASEGSGIAAMALERHWLRLVENLPEIDGEPSAHVIDELQRGFTHTRQETKRLRVFTAAASGFLLLAVAASYAAIEAMRQKGVAERNFAAAKGAADGLVIDITRGLRDVEGLRIDSVRKILARAESTINKLWASVPDNPALQNSAAAMHGEFATTYLSAGDSRASAVAAGKAVAIMEKILKRQPDDIQTRRNLALYLQKQADSETETGSHDVARRLHQRVLDIRRGIIKRNPSDARATRNVTVSLMRLGEIDETEGKYASAAGLFRQALDIRSSLARKHPKYRRSLTVAHIKLGDVQLELGEIKKAEESFAAAVAVARALVKEDQASSRFRRDLAVNLQRLGNLGVRTKNVGLARQSYAECLKIFERLSGTDKDNLEWSQDIAITRFKLGQAAVVAGEPEVAAREFDEALKLRRALLQKSPSNYQLLTDIAENLMLLAGVLAGDRKNDLLLEARNILLKLKQAGKTGRVHEKWLALIDGQIALHK